MHDGLHVVMTGEKRFDFTLNTNGHDASAPGNLGFDSVELHRIDKRQADVREKKNGVLVATVHEKVSQDGKELTTTTTMPSKPDQITVWTRTGGKKAIMDPFAGEWTQDLGKSRMRQGLPLKIEADGSGGVRFLGDYSYTAKFDGKAYNLKNSRNDTVTLQLVDAHTVDAVYQRDGRATDKDRWVVSPDGHQMTVTAAGTLETGQRVTEKLVFKK